MTIKAVLFDFDGTIADTHDALLEIVNDLADEFGYSPIDAVQLEFLKNLGSMEVVKYSQISPFKIPFILKRLKKELAKKIARLKPYQNIDAVLHQLKQQGYLVGIVTSNLKENVLTFLRKNDLEKTFDIIHSGTTIFGKNKMINRVLREHHLKAEEVIYVGDETRDIIAANKSHILMISVAWGFNSPSVLAKYHPDFLVHCPQELLEVITRLDPIPSLKK
ncbi:HAD-IA family hydrolase [Synechocystis sp. LKSZ1]|uniref:HAD-IA family hydrolase n=1 Tax=Synechocystis sp. LKSZ1 TaxID=3144951 RepID=UPI00336BAF0C